MPPDTERVRDQIRAMLPELREKYGVAELKLFGSRVRGDHRPDSDLDVLVTFREGTELSWLSLGGLVSDLEDRLGIAIDLAVRKNLKPILRPYILSEAVAV